MRWSHPDAAPRGRDTAQNRKTKVKNKIALISQTNVSKIQKYFLKIFNKIFRHILLHKFLCNSSVTRDFPYIFKNIIFQKSWEKLFSI